MKAPFESARSLTGPELSNILADDQYQTCNQFYPGIAGPVDSSSFSRIGRHAIEIVPGLGFLHNAIVDQHFIRRQRANRLFSVVLERPAFLGVGIDEGTVLKVTSDGKWAVLGRGAVMVVDARSARVTAAAQRAFGATDVKVSVLPAGSTFDPETGRGSLPQQ